jgi:hypothetical protein
MVSPDCMSHSFYGLWWDIHLITIHKRNLVVGIQTNRMISQEYFAVMIASDNNTLTMVVMCTLLQHIIVPQTQSSYTRHVPNGTLVEAIFWGVVPVAAVLEIIWYASCGIVGDYFVVGWGMYFCWLKGTAFNLTVEVGSLNSELRLRRKHVGLHSNINVCQCIYHFSLVTVC